MSDEFTWCPHVEPAGTSTFRVRSAQFGSGYKQVAGDGLNGEVQSWPLTFKGKEAEITAIVAFLRARAGHVPFTWTPPLGAQANWTCITFSTTPLGAGMFTLAATFEQYFGVV